VSCLVTEWPHCLCYLLSLSLLYTHQENIPKVFGIFVFGFMSFMSWSESVSWLMSDVSSDKCTVPSNNALLPPYIPPHHC